MFEFEGNGVYFEIKELGMLQACSWVQKMSGGADFNVEEESKGLPEDGIPDVRPLR